MRIWQRKPGGPWWVDFTVPGQPRFRQSSSTADKLKASEWAAHAQASAWRQGKLGERVEHTWGEALADWLTKHAHERRSIETMKERLRWLTEAIGKDRPLRQITRPFVEKLMAEKVRVGIVSRMKNEKKRPPPRPVAPKTLNNHATEISKILNHARALEWLDAVPVLRKYGTDDGPINWLTQQEAAKVLNELPPHLRCMAEFALATGLRESNVRLLRWKKVDLERQIAWVESADAKAKKPIGVPLNDEAMDVLRGQLKKHAVWVFPYTPIPKKGEKPKTGPVTSCSTRAWYKATARAGVPDFRWHDWRHTWASWHVQNGTPLPVLQQLGGWSSFAMVQRYAHLGRDHTAAYAGNVSRHIHGTHHIADAGNMAQVPDLMGWLMGLEPTTTGITICEPRPNVLNLQERMPAKRRKVA